MCALLFVAICKGLGELRNTEKGLGLLKEHAGRHTWRVVVLKVELRTEMTSFIIHSSNQYVRMHLLRANPLLQITLLLKSSFCFKKRSLYLKREALFLSQEEKEPPLWNSSSSKEVTVATTLF